MSEEDIEDDVLEQPPSMWITVSLIGFTSLVINLVIFQKERAKRKHNETLFVTRLSRMSSMCCIVCGVIMSFFWTVGHINILCYIARPMGIIFSTLQSVSMGFYQLQRLYYCFSQTKVHSNKGYSNCLFYVMNSLGIIIVINTFTLFALVQFPYSCTINKDFRSVEKTKFNEALEAPYEIASFSAVFLYIVWDISTLVLYIVKIISFRKFKSEDIAVYNRIMSILNRVLILTNNQMHVLTHNRRNSNQFKKRSQNKNHFIR
eukprot:212716_1